MALGNTLGVSQVEAIEVKVAASTPAGLVLHEVQKGDSLWKIANRPMLSDPDKIYLGQMLRIPNRG